jgi:imidazole glycerol-phosphate synthase subunit HisH
VITIVNYGTSNLGSIQNMLKKLGVASKVASEAGDLDDAERIILPGVGAFDAGMGKLLASGMIPTLNRKVLEERVPTLGVCLGMQLMTEGSEEGELPGLGWLQAKARRFDQTADPGLRVPHMAWCEVHPTKGHSLTDHMADGDRFYFAHSYHVVANDPADVLLQATYGRTTFNAGVGTGNIAGMQFHPEKSHRFGMALLSRFAGLNA